jgi:hypothetical protein
LVRDQFGIGRTEKPLVFLLAEPKVKIREVNVGSGSRDGSIGKDGVRQHGQDLYRSATDLASSKNRYPLIRHCDGGGSINRTEDGGHEQHARDDDHPEEDERQRYRNGEDQHQKCGSSSRIGADNPNAVFSGTRAGSQELFALPQPL